MTDPHHLADLLLDDQAVDRAARRVAGALAAMHAFTATPAAAVYTAEVRRLAWRAAAAVADLLEVVQMGDATSHTVGTLPAALWRR